MKSLLLFFSLCFLLQQGHAQEAAHENPPFWFEEIDKSLAYARENHVPIVVVFAGSDWCKPCMQFKKEVLLSDAFMAYAPGHLAVLYLDFPMRKENKLDENQTRHNESLAEEFNSNGAFPKIIVLNEQRELQGDIPYRRQDAATFLEQLKALSQ